MVIKIGKSFEFEKSGFTFLKVGNFQIYLERTEIFDKWPVVEKHKEYMEVWFLGRHLTLG